MSHLQIYKYPITPPDMFMPDLVLEIQMPTKAKLLCCQAQHGEPMLWALVDPANELCTRKIRIFMPGELIDSKLGLRFIDTVQLEAGQIVICVFDEGEV